MKIIEVKRGMAVTIMPEPYKPIKLEISYTALVEEDKPKDVEEELNDMCRAKLRKEAKDILHPNLKYLEPKLLTHPNVPKPLHGVTPRAIKGKKWWDKKRQEVYLKTEHCCTACGVHKDLAQGKKWMEAHESYEIDYIEQVTKVKRYDGLCHYCHNFIHSGRMTALLEKKAMFKGKVISVLKHGVAILEANKLKINPVTAKLCDNLGVEYSCDVVTVPEIKNWSEWYLDFEGEKHYSRFKNEKEWKAHYNKKDNKLKK